MQSRASRLSHFADFMLSEDSWLADAAPCRLYRCKKGINIHYWHLVKKSGLKCKGRGHSRLTHQSWSTRPHPAGEMAEVSSNNIECLRRAQPVYFTSLEAQKRAVLSRFMHFWLFDPQLFYLFKWMLRDWSTLKLQSGRDIHFWVNASFSMQWVRPKNLYFRCYWGPHMWKHVACLVWCVTWKTHSR